MKIYPSWLVAPHQTADVPKSQVCIKIRADEFADRQEFSQAPFNGRGQQPLRPRHLSFTICQKYRQPRSHF
jgi:hypothetical protein